MRTSCLCKISFLSGACIWELYKHADCDNSYQTTHLHSLVCAFTNCGYDNTIFQLDPSHFHLLDIYPTINETLTDENSVTREITVAVTIINIGTEEHVCRPRSESSLRSSLILVDTICNCLNQQGTSLSSKTNLNEFNRIAAHAKHVSFQGPYCTSHTAWLGLCDR